MSLTYQILQLSDLDAILTFERKKNGIESGVPAFAEWTAPWRTESLQHHLPLGWSFGLFDEQKNLVGYFLGQPLLFFQSQTQTLWVEHVSAIDQENFGELARLARSVARDKHLQRTLFFCDGVKEQNQFLDSIAEQTFRAIDVNCVAVNTTKMSGER